MLVTNHITFKFSLESKGAASPRPHCSRMETLTWKLFQDPWSATAAFLEDGVAGCSLLLSFVVTLNAVRDHVHNRMKSMSVLRADVLKRQHRVLTVPFVAMPGMAEFSSSSCKSRVTALPLVTS